MKTLYVLFSQNANGQIFFDSKLNFVNFIHENDSSYDDEYHGFIPKFFGGKIINLGNKDEFDIDEFDLDPKDYFNKLKPILKKMI